MAATVTDSFNRSIQDTTMSLEQLRKVIRSMAEGDVGKPTAQPETKSMSDEAITSIKNILEKYSSDFDPKNTIKYLEQMRDSLKEMEGKKKESKQKNIAGKQVKSTSKAEEIMAKQLGQLQFHHSKASAYTYDIRSNAKLNEILKALKIKDKTAKVKKTFDGGFKVTTQMATTKQVRRTLERDKLHGGTGQAASVTQRDPDKEKKSLASGFAKVKAVTDKIETAIFDGKLLSKILGGIGKDDIDFMKNSRAAAFEIDGITSDTQTIQDTMGAISKEEAKTADFDKKRFVFGEKTALTGQERVVLEKAYVKNRRLGIRDEKTALKLGVAQLHTETMIGVESGALSETFADWHQSLGMNVGQMAEMGRGLRDVAHFTGVTGDNLVKAVQSSEQFLKQMRNAGTLTAAAAKNVLEISANAQKFGVTDAISPLMKAMSSSTHFYLEASSQTQAFLAASAKNAGRLDELLNGSILNTKEGIKDMAEGMEMQFKRIAGVSMKDFNKLSADEKKIANIRLKSATGMEGGEHIRVVKTMKESGKGLDERLGEIDTQLQKVSDPKTIDLLNEQARALKVSAGMSLLNALDEATEGTDDMGAALKDFGDRARKDFGKDMKAMGIDATDNADIAKKAIDTVIENINAQRLKQGRSAIVVSEEKRKKAVLNREDMKTLRDELVEAQQETSTAAKKAMDHVTDAMFEAAKMNDKLRTTLQEQVIPLLDKIDKDLLKDFFFYGALAMDFAELAIQAGILALAFINLIATLGGVGGAAAAAGTVIGALAGFALALAPLVVAGGLLWMLNDALDDLTKEKQKTAELERKNDITRNKVIIPAVDRRNQELAKAGKADALEDEVKKLERDIATRKKQVEQGEKDAQILETTYQNTGQSMAVKFIANVQRNNDKAWALHKEEVNAELREIPGGNEAINRAEGLLGTKKALEQQQKELESAKIRLAEVRKVEEAKITPETKAADKKLLEDSLKEAEKQRNRESRRMLLGNDVSKQLDEADDKLAAMLKEQAETNKNQSTRGSIYVNDEHVVEAMGDGDKLTTDMLSTLDPIMDKLSMPIPNIGNIFGGLTTDNMFADKPTTAKTTSLTATDIQRQAEKDKAASQAVAGTSELGEIAQSNDLQVEIQNKMVGLLQKLVSQNMPSEGGASGGGGAGGTTNSVINEFTKYWDWYTGHQKDIASKKP